MDQRKALILAGILGVLIIAIIVGTIVYLSRGVQVSDTSTTKVVNSSALPIPSMSIAKPSAIPSQPGGAPQVSGSVKVYSGDGFQVQYLKDWGILTCSNSKNFELDPASSTDQLNVACARAVKPVTFIVRATAVSCPGSKVTLGSVTAVKSVDTSLGRTDYRWCTQTTPQLDISTRYAPNGGTATANTDLSSKVEDIISHLSFTTGS